MCGSGRCEIIAEKLVVSDTLCPVSVPGDAPASVQKRIGGRCQGGVGEAGVAMARTAWITVGVIQSGTWRWSVMWLAIEMLLESSVGEWMVKRVVTRMPCSIERVRRLGSVRRVGLGHVVSAEL